MRKTNFLFAVLITAMIVYAVPPNDDVGSGSSASFEVDGSAVAVDSILPTSLEVSVGVAPAQIFISCNQCKGQSIDGVVIGVVPSAKYGYDQHTLFAMRENAFTKPAYNLRC